MAKKPQDEASKAEPNEEAKPEEALSPQDSFKLDLYFWLQAMSMALILLIVAFMLFGRIIGVDGSSMLPTLHHGDLLLLQSLGYEPRAGDVVVLNKSFGSIHEPIVKRVIALGGQRVDIDYRAGTVSVDGQVLDEPYLAEAMEPPSYEHITTVEVPEGSIFVMGDNRNHSTDRRYPELGVVDQRYVLGRALFVFLPFSSLGAVA